MRASEAMIVWTPPAACADFDAEESQSTGAVRVVRWPGQAEVAEHYARRGGACTPSWRAASNELLTTRLFHTFTRLVLRYGLQPHAVHAALLDIDEYRQALADSGLVSARSSAAKPSGKLTDSAI